MYQPGGGPRQPEMDFEKIMGGIRDGIGSLTQRFGGGGIGVAIVLVIGLIVVIWAASGIYTINPGEQPTLEHETSVKATLSGGQHLNRRPITSKSHPRPKPWNRPGRIPSRLRQISPCKTAIVTRQSAGRVLALATPLPVPSARPATTTTLNSLQSGASTTP